MLSNHHPQAQDANRKLVLKLGDAKADAEKARKRWNVSAASVIKSSKLDMLRKAGNSIGELEPLDLRGEGKGGWVGGWGGG